MQLCLMKLLTCEDMNASLCKEFSADEISNALFQIGQLKVPGPDGFPARFFQRNWGVVKEDIIAAVQLFFSSEIMPDEVNDMPIVLIPKVQYPVKLQEFRSIASAMSSIKLILNV